MFAGASAIAGVSLGIPLAIGAYKGKDAIDKIKAELSSEEDTDSIYDAAFEEGEEEIA